jgi:hypothetical protein
MPKPPLSMIAINPVLADRADDFENWPRNFVLTASPLLNSFCLSADVR